MSFWVLLSHMTFYHLSLSNVHHIFTTLTQMEKLVEVSDQEVKIDFSLHTKCRATVRIHSLIATCPVAFKVQTSSPHKFLVNPPNGLVSPLSYTTFQLILKPQSTFPSNFPRSPSDRFLIKTVLAPHASSSRSPHLEFINSLFSSNSSSSSYDVRLGVAFVGPTLLRHAVSKGDANTVKKILKWQRSLLVELPALEAESLFRIAGNSDRMTSLLVQAGLKTTDTADIDIVKLENPLHIAAEFDRTAEIASMIKNGVQLDCRDKEGRTALMLAASKGCENSVRVLAGVGANVDAVSKDGRTGLYVATVNGDRRMVEVLMDLGADPTVGSVDHGGSPVDVAREKGFKEVLELLEQGETVLTAARRGDSIHLERLLNRGASPIWHDQYGLTPLHVAAIKGHIDTVTLLLEFKSELDSCDHEGHTPLHLAVEGGSFETVEVLVNRGADVNAKSKKGASPLYIANAMTYDDIYEFLSQRGASGC